MLTQKRENPMAIRSKNALAGALLKLMLYKPFGEIPISDVTGRAGLARQTFYTNFQRKEDVLLYLLRGLFQRYHDKLAAAHPAPEDLLIDYFLFWADSRDFLALLFRQELGYLFEEANRAFFVEDTDVLNDLMAGESWQFPYVKASLAGVTYELLHMWITRGQGLSVDVLSIMTRNLLGGRIFG